MPNVKIKNKRIQQFSGIFKLKTFKKLFPLLHQNWFHLWHCKFLLSKKSDKEPINTYFLKHLTKIILIETFRFFPLN